MPEQQYLLIVDDEDEFLQLVLKRFLLKKSYPVQPLIAVDGYEALDFLNTNNIAAVVLDLRMLNLGGLEVCRAIRSEERFKNLPIIISSGYINEDDKKQLTKIGVQCFLHKPYPMEKLTDALDKIFNGK